MGGSGSTADLRSRGKESAKTSLIIRGKQKAALGPGDEKQTRLVRRGTSEHEAGGEGGSGFMGSQSDETACVQNGASKRLSKLRGAKKRRTGRTRKCENRSFSTTPYSGRGLKRR